MSVPDLKHVVERVHAERPHLLRHNTDAADVEFMMWLCQEPEMRQHRVGLLSKPGVGSKVPNGFTFPSSYRRDTKVSVDYICFPDGNRVDVIAGADNHPAPAGPAWQVANPANEWRDSDTYLDITGWPIFDSGTPAGGTVKRALLGMGWFCMIRAFRDWGGDALANFNWIEEHLDPDYYRIFADVEGIAHGNPDPWRDAGVDIFDSNWVNDFNRVLETLHARGKKAHVTFYGGRYHVPSWSDRQRAHDKFVTGVDEWGAIEAVECCNEFRVNRWTTGEVRDIASDLKNKLPSGVRLALSSPALAHDYIDGRDATNEEMADSIGELYDSIGDEITVHLMRDSRSKWSDPFAYNGLTALPLRNNEPRGPGASAGGDIADAAAIVDDYRRTSEAGWTHYTAHSAWSVFNGRLPNQYRRPYDVLNVWEHENMEAIAHGLRAYRESGEVIVQPPSRPSPPRRAHDRLLPGQYLLPGERLTAPNGKFYLEYQNDGNVVIYEVAAQSPRRSGAIWASQTAGIPGGGLVMQTDGHLVLYDENGTPRRASHTWGNDGAMVQLQDDGNLVIYRDGEPIWASETSKWFDEHDNVVETH